ncbi:hypothetical protein CR513_51167, partial [Mucuna pruriens]
MNDFNIDGVTICNILQILYDSNLKYDTCILVKCHHVYYPSSLTKSETSFILIHSNVWGLSTIFTLCHDCTCMTCFYVMRHKNEFKFSTLTMEENRLTKNFIFTFKLIELFMKLHALRHHNKMVSSKERIDITFIFGLMQLLEFKCSPCMFHVASSYLWILAFVHLHKNQQLKLDPCTLHCIFLGYATHQKGIIVTILPQNKHVTMDVTFLEFETYFSIPTCNSPL